jgi:hypothetical protein
MINTKLVETLHKQITDNDLRFYWFITLEYYHKITDLNKVRSDDYRLAYIIKKFFKSNIKMWFFPEKHRSSVKVKDGYHRHVIMESIPNHCWKNRSNQMDKFILEVDPNILHNIVFGKMPSCSNQKDLLYKVIRGFNNSIPNGKDGVDIRLITEEKGGVKGLCRYLTKDNWKYGERIEDVIDWENSDCLDIESLARLDKTNSINQQLRLLSQNTARLTLNKANS